MLIESRKLEEASHLSLIVSEKPKRISESDDGSSCHDSENSDQSQLFGKQGCFFVRAPEGQTARILTWIFLVPVVWGVLYSILGNEALPKGNVFSILCLLLLAHIAGIFSAKLNLPPLLGMLLIGIAVRSVPYLDIVGTSIDPKWSAVLRKVACVVILTRAGLGLDPKALRQLSFMVIRLGILPNLVEMTIVSVVAHFLLDFPWIWSFMLGFILSGVSPSVVVPCMLSLSDQGYGIGKGVPTLIIAGLSIDNVLSFTGFGILHGIIFSDGSVMWQAFKGPIEILVGLLYGIILGSLCWILPQKSAKYVGALRLTLLISLNLLAMFGSTKIEFGGAGPIACLATSFVAGIGWSNQGWTGEKHLVKNNLNFVWKFFLPLLFGLIGKEIDISALEGNTVAFGVITLLIGLTFRLTMSYFVVSGGTLNIRERIFVAISWIPKATVQAAIGSVAYDTAMTFNKENPDVDIPEIFLGKQVLTLAVLVIVVAAPIGAAAIMLSAPKLLKKDTSTDQGVEIA